MAGGNEDTLADALPATNEDARDPEARRAALRRLRAEMETEVRARLRTLRATLSEAAAPVMDVQEAGVEDVERDLEVALAEMESSTLKLIREAMRRLEDRTYGMCRGCGTDIPEIRLRALPFTSLCRDCQERAEEEAEEPLLSGDIIPLPVR
jgi:DnaK suppressor protein